MTFDALFQRAMGGVGAPQPYPYQERLAEGPWPDVLAVPTGLGKTAAVGLSWIHKRLAQDPETPRRLVYCLPMRTLVEQTATSFRSWLQALDLWDRPGEGGFSVSVLMGGSDDVRGASWARHPEENAVLVGTQDMLLSRALMRGYGMSRYQWPVEFALLHADAFWVFDEVQLMGPALVTSTQLEGFRRSTSLPRATRSLWLSATLRKEWLGSVDFSPHLDRLAIRELGEDDRARAATRLTAEKRLSRAQASLMSATAADVGRYVTALADEVVGAHRPGRQTIVILNRVSRAQALARELRRRALAVPTLLLHARFRPAERQAIEDRLKETPGPEGRIVVATQAIEAGVDISSAVLFTELAPWSSLVQRFGRCNRYGEVPSADVYWMDVGTDKDLATPYDEPALLDSRALLDARDQVGIPHLPPPTGEWPVQHTLRRRDFQDLFSTESDLSGFDLDIAPYIRDPGPPQVSAFWRAFADQPGEQPIPHRSELCPVSMGQLRDYLAKDRRAFVWDPLLERWRAQGKQDRVLPGSQVLLRAADGGYDAELGFTASSRAAVAPVAVPGLPQPESYAEDRLSGERRWISLAQHLADVAQAVASVCEALGVSLPQRDALVTAAKWHDVGKAHPAFQRALLANGGPSASGPEESQLWAKSGHGGRLRYTVIGPDEAEQERPRFRHELASALAWMALHPSTPEADLVAFLIAAHHGRVRTSLRALPDEPLPDDGTRYARGIREGDQLPEIRTEDDVVPAVVMDLRVMDMGRSAAGPSWAERVQTLLQVRGPFELTWLEALLRIADWRASAAEEVSP